MTITLSFAWLAEPSFWGGLFVGFGLACAIGLVIFFEAAKA